MKGQKGTAIDGQEKSLKVFMNTKFMKGQDRPLKPYWNSDINECIFFYFFMKYESLRHCEKVLICDEITACLRFYAEATNTLNT